MRLVPLLLAFAAALPGQVALPAPEPAPPPEFVQAVEFPYYLYPRTLWERELVWLKTVGIRTVEFSIPWNWHQVDGLGLNERELELLQVSVPKQHYYVVSKLGRRLVDLRLGKVALAWLGVSGREDRQVVQSVIDEYPSTWRTEWLRLKVPTWSDYFRTLETTEKEEKSLCVSL